MNVATPIDAGASIVGHRLIARLPLIRVALKRRLSRAIVR